MTHSSIMAGKKLLVADDSLTIQKVIRLALSNEGYEIQAVSDGNDAVQQISLFRPHVVLIDVSLPGKSAVEVKSAINEDPDFEEIRFVLMSSAFEKIDETALGEVGFHGRLTKPFDPAHLRQVLSDVLAQVTAKRMEPTSVFQHPGAAALANPAPPPLPSQAPIFREFPPPLPPSMDANEDYGTVVPSVPGIQESMAPPPLPPSGLDSAGDADATRSFMVSPPSSHPGGEMPGDLWDRPETANHAFHPEFPPPPLPTGNSGEDIKHLTESTIRMSGLDDYQWSVNESSIKPPPLGEATNGTGSFSIEGPSGFVETNADITRSVTLELPKPPTAPEMDSAPAMSSFEIEAMVRKQVQESIEKIARQILPDVAEKVIKQELRRLLSERP